MKKRLLTLLLTLFSSQIFACNISGVVNADSNYERTVDTTLVLNININCDINSDVGSINLSLDTGESGTSDYRYLINMNGTVNGIVGSDRLKYYIYTSLDNGKIFGDGTGNSEKILISNNVTGTMSHQSLLRIPSNQMSRPGEYIDNLDITVEY